MSRALFLTGAISRAAKANAAARFGGVAALNSPKQGGFWGSARSAMHTLLLLKLLHRPACASSAVRSYSSAHEEESYEVSRLLA